MALKYLKNSLSILLIIFNVLALVSSNFATSGPELAATTPSEVWSFPLRNKIHLLKTFQKPATKYSAGHRGIDFTAVPGDAVYAPTSGMVSFVGQVVDRSLITLRTDSGILISIEPVSSAYKVGDTVVKGSKIGTVSEGAHCHLECIHLGVRFEGNYLNPIKFFVKKPQLLPL